MQVTNVTKDVADYMTFTNVIKTVTVREFTQAFISDVVPDYFAHIPASASGKYHPEYSLGEGGLLRHSMAVATILKDIIDLEYLQLSRYDKDLLIAAALVHDSFKQGLTQSGTTVRTHPNIAAQKLIEYGKQVGQEKIAQVMAGLVIAHMGQFGNQKPGNRGQFLVHLADFLASRKWLTVTWDHVLEQVEAAKARETR